MTVEITDIQLMAKKSLFWYKLMRSFTILMVVVLAVMFVVMFKFGLYAVMLVHFLYDLLIYLVIAADSMVEKKRGFV